MQQLMDAKSEAIDERIDQMLRSLTLESDRAIRNLTLKMLEEEELRWISRI